MESYDDIEKLIAIFETKVIPESFTLMDVGFIIEPLHQLQEHADDEFAYKGIIAYSANDTIRALAANLPPWLVFSWTKKQGELNEEKNTIGSVVPITFLVTDYSRSNPVNAKVDTGANISSLHVDNYHIDQGTGRITFTSSVLSTNRLTMSLDDKHLVKTADGAEPRPVVKLDIEINRQKIKDVQFNLNDRSQMEHPVLIGTNALEQGSFLIDPVQESLQWTLLNKPEAIQSKLNVEEVYEVFAKSNVTLGDLIRHLRTKIIEENL